VTDTTPILVVALVTGVGTLIVVIYQAVRFFRNNRGE
jgi:hypothetical protein